MRNGLIAALIGLMVAAPALAQRAQPPITPEGLGAVRIGMNRQQVERALGRRLVGEPIESEQACVERSPAGSQNGPYLMFENYRLTRITIGRNSRIATPRGIRIGATEAQVRTAYGAALQSEPHHYIGLPARYLTVWVNRTRGVRFVTDENRRVVNIIAGSRSIEYVEGCA